MEEEFLALLKGNAPLTALVADRINWVLRPQGKALPGLTLTIVSGVTDYHLCGPSGFWEPRVQVDVWAKTYTSAKAVVRAIKAAIATMPVGHIQGVFVDSERDLTDTSQPDVIFQISLDLMVKYNP